MDKETLLRRALGESQEAFDAYLNSPEYRGQLLKKIGLLLTNEGKPILAKYIEKYNEAYLEEMDESLNALASRLEHTQRYANGHQQYYHRNNIPSAMDTDFFIESGFEKLVQKMGLVSAEIERRTSTASSSVAEDLFEKTVDEILAPLKTPPTDYGEQKYKIEKAKLIAEAEAIINTAHKSVITIAGFPDRARLIDDALTR